MGPSNLLWAEPTGYRASMVGFPYDDLDGWRTVYPPQVFIDQMEKVASGFREGIAILEQARSKMPPEIRNNLGRLPAEWIALQREIDVARASELHFQSTANQSRFVMARDALAKATTRRGRPPVARGAGTLARGGDRRRPPTL